MSLTEIAKSFVRKDLPGSEVELSGTIPYDSVLPHREEALRHIAQEIEMPGFRAGHVPTDLALKQVGEIAVLEEAVEHVVDELYPELITLHSLDIVGRPDIKITKLAPGNPVELTVHVAVYPEVTLPKDWKEIAAKVPQEEAKPATEEDVTQTLEQLRQSRKSKKEDGTEVVPELNDEFAKSVGAFQTLDELKTQMTKGISEEKERQAKDKRRSAIIEKVLEKVTVEIPKIFVESELEKIIGQLKDDVVRFGLTFEGYLQQSKKTEEQLREDFRDQATKRAKLQLTLNKIAEVEKVEVDKAAADEEMKHALEHFPDARPDLLRIHIETVLRNEKTLQLIEGVESK